MKPLNDSEKKKATNRFIGICVLSFLIVFLAAYLLFSSPLNIYKQAIKGQSEFMAENDTIVQKTSRITQVIKGLRESENQYSNGSLNQVEENKIASLLPNVQSDVADLTQDSNSIGFPILKKSLANYVVAYQAIFDYGSNAQSLRRSNENLKESVANSSKGDNGLMLLQNQLTTCQNKNDELNKQLLEAKSNKGGGGPALVAGLTAAEVLKLKDDLANVTNDRDKFKNEAAESDAKLKDALSKNGAGTPAVAGCSEGDKSKLLYSAADNLCNKASQADKKIRPGYWHSALEILHSQAMKSYADQQKLADKIKEINILLNPIPNN